MENTIGSNFSDDLDPGLDAFVDRWFVALAMLERDGSAIVLEEAALDEKSEGLVAENDVGECVRGQ